MNRELWIAILTFVSFALTLATKALPVSPDLSSVMLYLAALVDAALAIFFGYTGVKTLRAKNSSAQKV